MTIEDIRAIGAELSRHLKEVHEIDATVSISVEAGSNIVGIIGVTVRSRDEDDVKIAEMDCEDFLKTATSLAMTISTHRTSYRSTMITDGWENGHSTFVATATWET